jgi:hypothetical protein
MTRRRTDGRVGRFAVSRATGAGDRRPSSTTLSRSPTAEPRSTPGTRFRRANRVTRDAGSRSPVDTDAGSAPPRGRGDVPSGRPSWGSVDLVGGGGVARSVDDSLVATVRARAVPGLGSDDGRGARRSGRRCHESERCQDTTAGARRPRTRGRHGGARGAAVPAAGDRMGGDRRPSSRSAHVHVRVVRWRTTSSRCTSVTGSGPSCP